MKKCVFNTCSSSLILTRSLQKKNNDFIKNKVIHILLTIINYCYHLLLTFPFNVKKKYNNLKRQTVMPILNRIAYIPYIYE